jgi:hypothetical protein
MIKKYNYLSKLDKVLLFFFIVNNELSPLRAWKILVANVITLHDDVSKGKKALISKILLHILFGIFNFFSFVISFAFILAVYVLVSVVTIIPSFVLVVLLSVFYGLFPFLLENNEINNHNEPQKEIESLKGYHKLRKPIYISWSILRENSSFLIRTGHAPIIRFKALESENQTHIIEQISLAIASVISMVIYSGLLFASIDIVLFIPLTIVAVIFGTVWFFVHFINSLTTKRDE